jgi:para-aminobenzoate synthetase component 1
VLNWATRFNTFCFLDNHQYATRPHSVECLIAAGSVDFVKANTGAALEQLQQFISKDEKWIFGHLGFDLKNEIEGLYSSHEDLVQFPDLFFFQPEVVIRLEKTRMIIEAVAEDEERIFREILSVSDPKVSTGAPITIQNRFIKHEYISRIEKLKAHILRGDCYEINFCQEFFSSDVTLDPLATYRKLSAISPNPFSAFYKLDGKYLLCASPERFLRKQGGRVLSQPIKGTAKRMADRRADEQSKEELTWSAKDRSENVMVVDLVRNDLSKICVEGTVVVDELYGIYSFPQVHQMISTVSGELRDNISFSEIIKATFPMGSMTGAPKKNVLQLIDKYEKSKRGIFSGAVGYISPDGDFDLNVVIRSIMYNSENKYLSFQTGSAITFYSDPEKEWEECMLKAQAIKQVLKNG